MGVSICDSWKRIANQLLQRRSFAVVLAVVVVVVLSSIACVVRAYRKDVNSTAHGEGATDPARFKVLFQLQIMEFLKTNERLDTGRLREIWNEVAEQLRGDNEEKSSFLTFVRKMEEPLTGCKFTERDIRVGVGLYPVCGLLGALYPV